MTSKKTTADILDIGNDHPPAPAAGPDFNQPDWFDVEAYLRANPDVRTSVAAKEFESAYHHYVLHGRKEGRPLTVDAPDKLNCLVRDPPTAQASMERSEVRFSIEVAMLSPRGGVMVIGWVDDMSIALEWLKVSAEGWHFTVTPNHLARFRRTDVESSLGAVGVHSFGFFAFVYAGEPLGDSDSCKVSLCMTDQRQLSKTLPLKRVSEIELRNTALGYVSDSEFFGNRQVEAVQLLRGPIGNAIVKHNRDISADIVRGAHVEHFGPRGGKILGSMVVCLYGKPEYLFLQNALFAGGRGFEDYEMVYVSNSPEMAEKLMKDMRTATQVYGLRQTLVLLPGNAGFGAANNVAVNHASSNRILIVNPDVFPRDPDWAHKHTEIIAELPYGQTDLFGVPLYYDDGTLMHGGMYFEYDVGLSGNATAMTGRRMVRVEHYGKGAPAWSEEFTQSRPVPAVTGAFMSINRPWYEKLGGFTEDFVFGHYEDADLCLKSIFAGTAPWIHDIRLWHLEGKGSTRLPVHEGGSYVNRGIFSDRWDSMISNGLQGRRPTHRLLNPNAAPPPSAKEGLLSRVKSSLAFPKSSTKGERPAKGERG